MHFLFCATYQFIIVCLLLVALFGSKIKIVSMDADLLNNKAFSAEDFLNNLLNDASTRWCDESNGNFCHCKELPTFYNEDKFKRGQKFYHRNIFAMFLGKLMGLISILAVPSILKILQFTNMSSEPMSAYKRYLATIFHMIIWYDSDFKPGSDLWKSIEQVKNKHNYASKRSCTAGFKRISQLDMALTQFGFMGYAITRPRPIGIHNAKKEDLEAFVHIWRVIGHIMGIEERYNICRESLEETQEICSLLLERVFKLHVEELQEGFLHMSHALIDGMWAMSPMLEPHVCMVFLIRLVNNTRFVENNPVYKELYTKLNMYQKFKFWLMKSTMSTYRFTILRWYHNTVKYITFWLMRNFPFLAFYKYGKKNSFVTIIDSSNRKCASG